MILILKVIYKKHPTVSINLTEIYIRITMNIIHTIKFLKSINQLL